ncbi:Fc.00g018700.m01.CDS01 [Cosmosporella sp. VM-42]
MEDKIIALITGANQGVGFQTARILLQSNQYHIIVGSRVIANGSSAAEKLKALPETRGIVEAIQIDVTDDRSVDSAAEKIASTHHRLDVLVNNAGIGPQSAFAGKEPSAPSSRETLRTVFNTNVVGAVSATEALLPLLRKSSSPRLIFVSSSTGSLAHASDPSSRLHAVGRSEYRASKAALNFLMVQYSTALKDERFLVFGADPGLNATNLTGNADSLRVRGAPEPQVGGERIAKVVRGDRDADAGTVCGEYGESNVCPW